MNGVVKDYATPIRLYDYEKVCGAVGETSYPEKYEIPRENTGTLKNQGDIQKCVGCVISEIAEELYRQESNERLEMSDDFAYSALRDDSDNYSGMTVVKALGYWRKIGIVPKPYFTIEQEMPEIQQTVKKIPELFDIAKRYRIGGYCAIHYADKNKRDLAIKKALTENNYGIVAVSDHGFGSSHCIQITGWDDTRDKYLLKNSWGETYGDKGFSAVSKSAIDQAYVILKDETTLPFTDVDKSHWAYKSIKNMYLSGLMSGTGETTFEPDRGITRAEAAALMDRIVKMTDKRFAIFNKVLNEQIKNE